MADIRIHRDHQLGLAQARQVALQWAEDVEARFDMDCTIVEGKTSDTVEFKRSGVSGQLIVAADHFDLQARLGFLLGAFSKTIEGEIEKNLDTLLAKGAVKGAIRGAEKTEEKGAVKVAEKGAEKGAEKVGVKAEIQAATKGAAKVAGKKAATKPRG